MSQTPNKAHLGIVPSGRARPTIEEAMELSIIMSTPPSSDEFLTPVHKRRLEEKRRSGSQDTSKWPLTTSLVSPESAQTSFSGQASFLPPLSLPKIKIGPPYEPSLPLQIATSSRHKKCPLIPRSSIVKTVESTPSLLTKHLCHDGLGPFLSKLPESLLATIINFVDYRERHPKLFLISHSMTGILTRPDFFLAIRQTLRVGGPSTNFNEFLFVVGGKYPTKVCDLDEDSVIESEEGLNRRMPFKRNELGIMGFDMKRHVWLRFGGDPLQKAFSRHNSNELHPLSPMGIVNPKPLYIGHPYYSIFFLGGTHHESGLSSNRVIAYSFLTARWEDYPCLMRARDGDDFVVTSCNDSIFLIGCELEFCDCLRCNPTSIVKMQSMRKFEILDLKTRTWTRSQSSAPFCPPDDGGVAALGQYIYLPGTCTPLPTYEDSCESTVEIGTPTSQSVTNSYADFGLSQSSIGEMHTIATVDCDQLSSTSTTSMDIERECLETESTPLGLHYRPGLVYDVVADSFRVLPPRQYLTSASPATCTFRDTILVLGGYRSSSENALSCYRHREEEAILDYEDHLDFIWYYEHNTPFNPCEKDGGNGSWKFGGGTTMFGHTQAWAFDDKVADAVAAAATISSDIHNQIPNRAPVAVRGASALTFQDRLTVLGGLSTFSRTFYNEERKNIYSWYPETREWRRAPMQLPLPALLDGYAFSLHI